MSRSRVFPSSGYGSSWLSYRTVLCLTVLSFVCMFFLMPSSVYIWNGSETTVPGFTTPDTYSYIYSADDIMAGRPSISRTPMLPAMLGVLHKLFGTWVGMTIFYLLQFGLFVLSGYYLQRLAMKFTMNERVSFWITSIYLLLPSNISFTLAIMTDSLGMSGVVFMLWFLLRRLPSFPTVKDSVLSVAMVFLLVSLRPIFLYLIVAIVIYYIALLIRYKMAFVKPFVCAFMCVGVLLACLAVYQKAITAAYGIHSIASIGANNNVYIAAQINGWHPELAPDDELKTLLEDVESETNTTFEYQYQRVFDNYIDFHPLQTEEYSKRLMNHSLVNIGATTARKLIIDIPASRIAPNYFLPSYLLVDYLTYYAVYYVVLAWYLALCFVYMKRSGRVPVMSLLLMLVSVGIISASALGSMGEWPRLLMPGIPAAFLISGKLCSMYTRKAGALEQVM